jgi:hypothetical protein
MPHLNQWGIFPNFNIKHAIISYNKVSKKIAKFAIVPKNMNSIPLKRNAETAFDFKSKKFTHTIKGNYTIGTNKKRKTILTQGFQILVEKR